MTLLFLKLALAAVIATPLLGQNITVRLLDGKTGKPIANKNITFHWDNSQSSESTVVRIGKDGVGRTEILKGATAFSLMEGPKDGGEPYRVAYLDCNAYDTRPYIPISEVLSRGVVPRNTCGGKTRAPEAAVIVFWGMTRRWYQLDMQ